MLAWGVGAWKLDATAQKKLRHFNARMLLRIENADPTAEDYVEKVKAAHNEPAFDLVRTLRARRLRWLGHVLRSPESSLLRQVMLRKPTTEHGEGSIFDDPPPHASIEELVELAGNHDTQSGKRLIL